MTKHIRTAASVACGILFILTLTACGGGGGPTDPGQGGPPPTPTITITPTSGTVGTRFVMSGSGFTHGSSVTLHTINPPPFPESATHFGLNPSTPGAFVYNFDSGNVTGDYTVWAIDDTSGAKSNEVKYTVTPSTTPEILWTNRIGNSIKLILLRFTVGGKVDFRHTFPGGEDSRVIDFKGEGNCTSPCEFIQLDNLENGQHTVTATDRTTGISASNSFTAPAP